MAGYQTMADALLALLRAKTPASNRVKTRNSNAKGNWAVFGGGTDTAFVLTPGPFSRERVAFDGNKATDWDIDVNVLAKYDRDETVHDLIVGASQDVIDSVDAWPKLNGTTGVYLAEVVGGEEPTPLFDMRGGGPHWKLRPIRVRVTEDITVSENE